VFEGDVDSHTLQSRTFEPDEDKIECSDGIVQTLNGPIAVLRQLAEDKSELRSVVRVHSDVQITENLQWEVHERVENAVSGAVGVQELEEVLEKIGLVTGLDRRHGYCPNPLTTTSTDFKSSLMSSHRFQVSMYKI